MTQGMKELRDGCRFDHISHQPAPSSAAIESAASLGPTREFESRKRTEEDIMTALRGKEVDMMGICGMGGVGKTTMARRIMNRAREERLFDEVVMVDVRQQVDVFRVQLEIAESLGLELKEGTLSARAHKLRVRLMGTKRTLLILDDVWESFSLEDMGIPCQKCTILLTSRNREVLNAMDAKKFFSIHILSEREAWLLFREKAGVDDPILQKTAEAVARECKGLPLALITVARALKEKRDRRIWEDALQQLRSSNPTNMPAVLRDVYNPLKLSFDFLDNEHAKSLFLLCCLFPEDHNIHVEQLTLYGMGLRVFEGIRNLQEARNRAWTLIETLKNRFLLLDGRDNSHVKMHDVVRDVAIFIASKERRIVLSFNLMDSSAEEMYSSCAWISVFQQESIGFLMGLNFPNLRLLLIDNSGEELHRSTFQGMRELNVLSLSSLSSKSLPETIQLLKNLRTLSLHRCRLETISFVGELQSLEVFSCSSCHSITEVPLEMGSLTRLRLLEFSDCPKLRRIEPGVISSLVQLEELKMTNSFNRWETEEEGRERNNAALNELESLSNLTCLEIEIENSTLATKQICLSSKIVKYDIRIAERRQSNKLSANFGFEPTTSIDRKLFLELPGGITLGHWISEFLRITECLYLRGDGSANNLDIAQAQDLKWLSLKYCSNVKEMVNTKSMRNGFFSNLESLKIYNLRKFEKMCRGPIPEGSDSFRNLKELKLKWLPALKYLWKSPDQKVSLCNLSYIYISDCNNLRNVFTFKMANDYDLQLGSMEILSCKMMEVVFSSEKEERESVSKFPRLKRLMLDSLPRLADFYRGTEGIEFPVLSEMCVKYCPKLISLVSFVESDDPRSEGEGSHSHDDDSFHLFCNQKIVFGNLKTLEITGYENISNAWCPHIPMCFFSGLEKLTINSCHSIRSLFSTSIAANLFNLRQLTIVSCRTMVKVIADEEQILCEETSPFPNLRLLELTNLPKLEAFCQWRSELKLPSLKQVRVKECPMMRIFNMGSLTSTPNLESIEIDDEDIDMEDLNDGLHQHSRAKESTSGEEEQGDDEDEIKGED